jgi:hypothetical protein
MNLHCSPYIYVAELEVYFDKFSQHAQAREYWLEVNGYAFQYDLPLGVSLDLISEATLDLTAPIDMILHLKNPPQDFAPLLNKNQIKSRLLNSLKDVSFYECFDRKDVLRALQQDRQLQNLRRANRLREHVGVLLENKFQRLSDYL